MIYWYLLSDKGTLHHRATVCAHINIDGAQYRVAAYHREIAQPSPGVWAMVRGRPEEMVCPLSDRTIDGSWIAAGPDGRTMRITHPSRTTAERLAWSVIRTLWPIRHVSTPSSMDGRMVAGCQDAAGCDLGDT